MMKKHACFILIVLLLVGICLYFIGCNLPSQKEISFTSAEEAGITLPEKNSNNAEIISLTLGYQEKGNEWLTMRFLDSIVVGTVIGHEAFTQPKEKSWDYEEFSAVAHVVQVTDVLMGECEVGDTIHVCLVAEEVNNVYYAHPRTEMTGGFIEEGTQMLFFLKDNNHMADYYADSRGENLDYWVKVPANIYTSNRVVGSDGKLTFLEGNKFAGKSAFSQYETIDELRVGLPQIFETYRDAYKKDHPLLATYRATPNAEPGVPENYVYYADLPKEAEKE